VEFHPHFAEYVRQMEMPEDWGLFYFGCQHFVRPAMYSRGVVKVVGAVDLHAVAIHNRWFPLLLKILRLGKRAKLEVDERHEIGADSLIAALQGRIPSYAAFPNLASDILTCLERG